MNATLIKLIKKPLVFIRRLDKSYVLKEEFRNEIKRWFGDKGDDTLRMNYKLDGSSIVFDLGGYVGDFAEDIQKNSKCQVYLFEPSKEFFERSRRRFENSDNIHCFNYGLSNADGRFVLSNDDDGSSIKSERAEKGGELVEVRRFSDVFAELSLQHIDLLKINIEGGEYDVLPHLIESGLIEKIDNIQVQFHHFISGAVEKRNAIISELSKTHNCDWCYTFVWESWSLKKPTGVEGA